MKSSQYFFYDFRFLFLTVLLFHAVTLFYEFSLGENVDLTPSLNVKIVSREKYLRQLVQSSDSDQEIEKEKAFLSDRTRSFDRQTRARTTGSFSQLRKPEGKRNQGGKVSLRDLGSLVQSDPFRKSAQTYTREKNGEAGRDTSSTVSATSDYLPEIPLGDITGLNTVEYKYYGFYHRIRQKLEDFWGRSIQEKAEELARNGRRVPASTELITALVVVLDREGKIIDLFLRGSSGVRELDEAAVEAFNQAGPFPNPPKGMIVNGKVTLEWGFVVKS